MLNFFRRRQTSSRPQDGAEPSSGGDARAEPTAPPRRASQNKNELSNRDSSLTDLRPTCCKRSDSLTLNTKNTENHNITGTLTRKDVVNLLIPETKYATNQRQGSFTGLLQKMAGSRRRNKNKRQAKKPPTITTTTENKDLLHQETNGFENRFYVTANDSSSNESKFSPAESTQATDRNAPPSQEDVDDKASEKSADFVKALVLEKYANKSPVQNRKNAHISLVYVNNDQSDRELQRRSEKDYAEKLLNEIEKSLVTREDTSVCVTEETHPQMGAVDSKAEGNGFQNVPSNGPYIEITSEIDDAISSIKKDLSSELDKILQHEEKISIEDSSDTKSLESNESIITRKSNLKIPKSDNEGFSDDDNSRSDSGKKKVTFRKTIDFDDGDIQSDDAADSSFESFDDSDSDADQDDLEDDNLESGKPDNDELLGGVVVVRNDEISKIDESKFTVLTENSDSGFVENSGSSDDIEKDGSGVPTVKECDGADTSDGSDEEDLEEEEEEVTDEEEEDDEDEGEEEIVDKVIESNATKGLEINDEGKKLVNQEEQFSAQVSSLAELAGGRGVEADRLREELSAFRKDLVGKDAEIERLKTDLAYAYKEAELVRQRLKSLEEELSAARSCSGDLAAKLTVSNNDNDDSQRRLQSELSAALSRSAELEIRVKQLEDDTARLEEERKVQGKRAEEALSSAAASETRWRAAHEAARTQAAEQCELVLADCEWKTRELSKKARDAEKKADQLAIELKKVEEQKANSQVSAVQQAELDSLRGLTSEQQTSLRVLTAKCAAAESREEALRVEAERLRGVIDRDKEKTAELEKKHQEALTEQSTRLTVRAESARVHAERVNAERSRAALAQLRDEHERDARNAERKLKEAQVRLENLKEVVDKKESQFEYALQEARSKADWELLQLRHLLDKADIKYATALDDIQEKHEKEIERLTEEWSTRLQATEESAESAADTARDTLERTRNKMEAEKADQLNRLKEQHRREMDDQWENFMTDKETCLDRMKLECRLEGEEERTKREKDLVAEISELKAEIEIRNHTLEDLSVKSAACSRTLAVTEQELREALDREMALREQHSDDMKKLHKTEKESRETIEHLTRKCACLRKLFDDMRNRLSDRDKLTEEEATRKRKEIESLRVEVARLTKTIMDYGKINQNSERRTQADGCDATPQQEASFQTGPFLSQAGPRVSEARLSTPRRKGGGDFCPSTLQTLQLQQSNLRRSRSADLPAVQVPVRIKQLEQKNK